MRILLDESVPRALKRLLPGHDVRTVVEEGWGSIANGELLTRASNGFDVLLTADQNLPDQQNLTRFDIAVVVLIAPTNSMVDYEPIAEQIRLSVESARVGEALQVTA